MCHIPLENPWKIEKDLLHPTKKVWKSLTHFLPHPKIDGGSKNRSDFMHDAHGLFCWECIGAKPFSFQNVHLLWPLLGFLTNPYVQILPYFMPSPPTSSVVPASHTQCFQISSFQVSCFTYRSFMDLLNEARLISIMGDLKSGAVYLCMCLCLSKFIPKKI